MVILLQTAPVALMVGCVPPAGITTSVDAVGTAPPHQLEAVNQLVVVPTHVPFTFTVGKVAVLFDAGINEQLAVAMFVMVTVWPLLAVVNAIVLKEAVPPTPVTLAVCVPAVPPIV